MFHVSLSTKLHWDDISQIDFHQRVFSKQFQIFDEYVMTEDSRGEASAKKYALDKLLNKIVFVMLIFSFSPNI